MQSNVRNIAQGFPEGCIRASTMRRTHEDNSFACRPCISEVIPLMSCNQGLISISSKSIRNLQEHDTCLTTILPRLWHTYMIGRGCCCKLEMLQIPAGSRYSQIQFVAFLNHPGDVWQSHVIQQRTYWQKFGMGIHTKIRAHPAGHEAASLLARKYHSCDSMFASSAR